MYEQIYILSRVNSSSKNSCVKAAKRAKQTFNVSGIFGVIVIGTECKMFFT